MRIAAHAECVGPDGAVELYAVARVRRVDERRAGRRHGAVVVHADQLHGVGPVQGGQHVRGAVHGKGLDAVGILQAAKAARAVARLGCRLHGAVVAHADQLHGVVAERGHGGVRAAPHLERVDAYRGVQRVESAPVVAGRSGRDHLRQRVVDQHVARVRERAGRARRGQGQAGGVARQVGDVPVQGARPRIAEVVRAVARPHRVGEHEIPHARSRDVRRVAVGRPRLERKGGRGRSRRLVDLRGL